MDYPKYTFSDRSSAQTDSFNELEKEVASKLNKDGYAILRDFVDRDLIDEIVEDCKDKYINELQHENQNRRVQDAWSFSDSVAQLAGDKRIISLLSKVYGRKAFPFQTLNFKIGTEQRLHSDTIHFNSMPNLFMTGVWVALEDVTLENGPLRYIKGSNALPVFDCASMGIENSAPKQDPYVNYSRYEDVVENMVDSTDLQTEFAVMKKGDAFIWTANLIHGGSKINGVGTTRLSQVTHYYYDDCVYYTPLTSDLRTGKIHFRIPFDISAMQQRSLIGLLKSCKKQGFSMFQILRNLIYSRFGI